MGTPVMSTPEDQTTGTAGKITPSMSALRLRPVGMSTLEKSTLDMSTQRISTSEKQPDLCLSQKLGFRNRSIRGSLPSHFPVFCWVAFNGFLGHRQQSPQSRGRAANGGGNEPE